MATGWPMKVTYANGDVFSASDINDTNGTINLLGSSVAYAAGKNRIINGNFAINQRTFTSNTATGAYNFDRWLQTNGGTSGTLTITPQTFTPGTAPVSGYEGSTFIQCVTAAGANTNTYAILSQRIEDVRTFAGQTATVSFWAKAASGTPKIAVETEQLFGSGGSPSSAVTTAGGTAILSTSWARYSVTVSVPSISGKTIGTTANTSSLGINLWLSAGSDFASRASSIGLQNATFQIWGVQVEQGSTATAFQTATGTIQGELAACQRYLPAISGIYSPFFGYSSSTTNTFVSVVYPVTARVVPTGVTISSASHFQLINGGGGAPGTPTAIAFDSFNTGINGAGLTVTSTAGSPTIVSGQGGYIRIVNAAGSILFTGCEL
jgi:hypothetical protein